MIDPGWGLLPDAALQQLRAREWSNRKRLKQRLKGMELPNMEVKLKPPQGSSSLNDLGHFQRFVDAWRDFPHATCVRWKTISYRNLASQQLPASLMVADVATLAKLLGETEQLTLQLWQARISQILAEPFAQGAGLQRALFNLLIDYLEELERYTDLDTELLISLIPQLRSGMGGGGFLRALPVRHVDTKFIEQNYTLIEQITDLLHDGEVLASGGLLAWLDCRANPRGWLWVRPLCEHCRQALGGLPLLQLATDTLLDFELPARHVLVVENVQSGLALPPLKDTIAVFGGGKNLSWLDAEWLEQKRVGYWGDIDSEGLCMLADARRKLPSIDALLMDEQTLVQYQERMVDEPLSILAEPVGLNVEELRLFRNLRSGRFGKGRLEQERIAPDHVLEALNLWRSQQVPRS